MAKLTVESSIVIAAPREDVFHYVAEWRNARHYVPNVASLQQVGAVCYGLGTRLRGRAKLNGIPVDTLSEVVQFVELERIVCRSVSGPESTNIWLFYEDGSGTRLTAIVTYRLPGYLLGGIIARLISRELATSVERSLFNLKRILEGRRQKHDAD